MPERERLGPFGLTIATGVLWVRSLPRAVKEVAFGLLVVAGLVPLWVGHYLPLQDWPQHLATLKILHDYGDPALGFQEPFAVDLARTQYLAVYAVAHCLAYLTGVQLALKIVLTAALAALPYAMRGLLRVLGRSQWGAVLVLPLTFNAHLILGFVNFLAALPLMLWVVSLACWQRKSPRTERGFLLAAILAILFFTHIVPFGVAVLAMASVGIGWRVQSSLRRMAPLLPALLVGIPWLIGTAAGRSLLSAIGLGGDDAPRPQFQTWSRSLAELPHWLTDVFVGDWDARLLVAWGALVLAWGLAGWGRGARARGAGPLARRLLPVALLAGLGYLVLPVADGWIWPIQGRFALIFALMSLPLLPQPRVLWRVALGVACASLALVSFFEAGRAFREFDRGEVGMLDQALEIIPEGQHVAGLIFSPGSQQVSFSPFLHSVAYYQARKGGVVMFTFADFPASPVRFRAGPRPPRVPPRWEWSPHEVSARRDLGYYGWILVRGAGDWRPDDPAFSRVFRSARWQLWQRVRGRWTSVKRPSSEVP